MRRYQLIPSHAVQTLLITSVSPLPSGEIGAPYSFTFNAIGGVAPYTWSEVGAIPSGLTFSGGTLSGTPTGTFSSSFNVTVTDSVGSQFTRAFSLTVITAVQITTASPLPGGTVGVAYSTTIAATGGATPYSWSILGFTGANSYSINSVTGVLTGTLGVAEIDSINIQVVDALGIPSAKNFNLTVIPAASLTITTTSPLPAATQSSAYSTTMAATGGTPPYTWSLTSHTGSNTWSVSSGGVVTGTPSTIETDSLVIKVTDSVSATASGTFSLTVNSSASPNFFADPFSSFANVIADTTFGGTAGTTTTVSWNGGTISGPTYSTTQAAINALLIAGPGSNGRRVCRLLGQLETIGAATGSPIHIPGSTAAAGFTASLPFVIQSDPICTQAQLPAFDGGGTAKIGWMIGDQVDSGGNVTGSFNNTNVVIRKHETRNFSNVNGSDGIHIGAVGGGDYSGLIIEFNYIHTFRGSGSDGESGPVYCANSSNAQPGTIRFNKLADVLTIAGGLNVNHSCVGLYGGTWQIYNNEMSQANNGVRFKNNNHNVPNGNQVYNNYCHDCNDFIMTASGGEGPSVNGDLIYNNLCGWQHINDAVFQGGSFAVNDFGATGVGTLPMTTQFYNNTITAGWSGGFLNSVTQQCSFYNNVVLCGGIMVSCSENGSAGSITFCDFNAYFSGGTWVQNNEGSPQHTYSTFASWQAAFTTNAYHDLTANPDAHGIFIPNLSSSYNTILKLFPNSGAGDYTNAPGSPLIGAGQSGANMGCNMATVGPGW